MSAFTWFLIGFLSASALFLSAALSYYFRARKRVQAIESAIHRYQQASRVVGDAVNKAYSKS